MRWRVISRVIPESRKTTRDLATELHASSS